MVYALSQKYQKTVALLLITVFYCDFLMANYAQIKQAAGMDYSPAVNDYIGWNTVPVTPETETTDLKTETDPNKTSLEQNSDNNDAIINIQNDDSATDKYDSAEVSGPSQPEMSSFKPVGAENMVDLFTGDFSYNIPLMDVGGYPINIFYHSGISMDQEASWVGLGWNINPGTVTRNLRGLPDDFDGSNDKITKTQSIKENKTIGATVGGDIELVGLPLNLGASIGAFHNTYKGWGLETGMNATLSSGTPSKGGFTGGMGLSLNNNTQDGLTITPSLSLSMSKYGEDEKEGVTGSLSTSLSYNTRSGLKGLQMSTSVGMSVKRTYWGCDDNMENWYQYNEKGSFGSLNLFSSGISFASASYTPTISIPYTSQQISFTGKIGGEIWGTHGSLYVSGYASSNKIAPSDTTVSMPAYGYLNYQNASGNLSALLDFNREKDIPYHEKPSVPNIGIPSYTYDLFSISGEGTGGMFRAYRGDIGYVYDHLMATKSESGALSIDLGWGALFHGGVDLNQNNAVTQSQAWIDDNALKNSIGFKKSDSVYEAVYFRNPGEKSVNNKTFYDAVGGDDVVVPDLYQASISSPDIIATNNLKRYHNSVFTGTSVLSPAVYKKSRDKRAEVITYLSAQDASVVGLSKYIENYAVNRWGLRNCNKTFTGGGDTLKINDTLSIEKRVNSFRKANHISEIEVTNPDGRRYVYGIPVYNLVERDVTASVSFAKGSTEEGLAKYDIVNDNPIKHPDTNYPGRDDYYNKEEIPAYAHSFLLTAIVSPDYVDITGDGITDDDLGDAIKFNYSKVSGIANPYGWRAPYIKDSATYNEGLRTDIRDDRASYVYGQKELWYLNSIESKNMMATFAVSSCSDRLAADENGTKTQTNVAKKLDSIMLYSKADFLQNGTNAKPIKTVHFEYSYTLCPGVNRPYNTTTGKLTLTAIWFSYNGGTKKQNYYKFYYNGINPSYTLKANDRWGTYKDPTQNPGYTGTNKISNSEFPYALQDSTKAATNAGAWTLDSIILPSKAKIKVTYESDDYAFVQNKRAMQMFKIAGFGTSSSAFTQTLYDPASTNGNLFVFANVSDNVSTSGDVFNKYLQGISKIFFKVYVAYGTGHEFVPCYADIDLSGSNPYGVGLNSKQIFFKIKGINISADGDGSISPLAKAATEFVRLNLPALAYPGSDVGNNIGVKEAVSMVVGLVANVTSAFTQFDVNAMHKGLGNGFDSSRSFVRLNNASYKKYGGGLRVKKIVIYDGWNSMTGQKESKYGQQYSYTTTKEINGVQTLISSGVACYEPSIGGEENPWHQPLEYIQKVGPMAPTAMGYTETPLGESFFPAPFVGYSEVKIRSIYTDTVKSMTGTDVTKFYTSYDYPTITDFTSLLDNKKRYKPAIANFLRINAKHFLAISQGFKIELNDMNGKMRSQASYPATDSVNAISYTESFYKTDDPNATSKHLSNKASVVDASGVVDTAGIIGKDVELMVDMREQQSVTEGANVQLNVDVIPAVIFPIPIPSLWYMPQREEDLYRSVAVTKVIQRFGVLDSTVVVDKGSRVSTKNLLFDSETGDVLLTRTQNEFNDSIYNFTYPAHWAYSGMGPAYKNVQAIFNSDASTNIVVNNGSLNSTSKYPNMISYFESGDEIMVTGQRKTGEMTPTDCYGNQKACPVNTYATAYTTEEIWAINNKKIDASSGTGIVFIDSMGRPYSADSISMKILRSGKRNMSMTPVGSLTFLNNPVKTVSGKQQLVLDSNLNVLTCAAVPFNDYWHVKDARASRAFDGNCTCGPLKALFDYLIASSRLFISSSSGITVDSIVRAAANAGYPVSINDCGILSSNRYGLFYALTTSTADSVYRAQIGSSTVSITSNNHKVIHFNSLQSLACSGTDNKVYYQDNTQIEYNYRVTNARGTGGGEDVHYANCTANESGQFVTLTPGQSTCLFAFKGGVHGGSDIDTSYCSSTTHVCDTNAIYLYIQTCTSCPSYICYDPILDTTVNPYVYGIYGDWRSNKSLVYYGDRQETDVNVATNIRKNGAIKGFMPYWSFGSSYLTQSTDTTRWVWNAQSTLFNKKGYELENKDPLGRYNSGTYGYNETLPISVTQNSKYREQFFDGFEDYSYANTPCPVNCPLPKVADFSNGGGTLTTSYAHSGKYSLKVNNGATDSVKIVIVSANTDTVSAKMYSNITSKSMVDTTVNPNGHGLEFGYNSGVPNYDTGYIQATISGSYTIRSTISYTAFGGQTPKYTLVVGSNSQQVTNGANAVVTTYLIKGQKTKIQLQAQSGSYFTGSLLLEWTKAGCDGWSTYATVPAPDLDSLPALGKSVGYDTSYCNTFKGIKTDNTILNPTLSFTQGARYWFSAWVKEEQDCLCQNYTNNQVRFVFTDASNTVVKDTIAKPTGILIEGWQRYDFVLPVPSNAVSATMKLQSTGSTNVYFDDIRMHPFNANMQTFVYNPVNLRLMAQMDENNYASFYEYDDDGTLIRVKKETQRGIQTIKETRSYIVR